MPLRAIASVSGEAVVDKKGSNSWVKASRPQAAVMCRGGRILSKETGRSEPYYGDFLIHTLCEWTEQLALPKLSDYGVKARDLETIVEQTSNRNNPIKLTREEILAILSSR